jgi:sugar phosphate isomerase/epimerase
MSNVKVDYSMVRWSTADGPRFPDSQEVVPVLGRDDLVLCAGTVLGSAFRERVEAASAAGFRGITLWANDWHQALADGLSPADMRALLDDHGLEIGELDGVTDWIPGGTHAEELRASGFLVEQGVFWEMAEALGGRSLNVVEIMGAAVDAERAAEGFAALCDRAADHGLLVHLEPLPWSGVPDLPAAARIVDLADRANGGVLLDTWHHFRAGLGVGDLSPEAAARVNGIQINDAPAKAEDDLMDETMHRRLLPGHGDAAVADTLRALRAAGVDAPIGVEVFSDELAALPVAEAARRAAEAARAVVADAA